MSQFVRITNGLGWIDSRERIDRLFKYLWGPWVAFAGRGLFFVVVVAVVSLRGVGFCVFFELGPRDSRWNPQHQMGHKVGYAKPRQGFPPRRSAYLSVSR